MANSSYYTSGGGGVSAPARSYEPPIDKNPIYRTNDTFKRAYKKNIAVLEGQVNQTDCVSTIWVKFCDPIDRAIVEVQGAERMRARCLLECGHMWEGKKDTLPLVGQTVSCLACGSEQGYLGFEHEWQHILFKTDPKMAKVFIQAWATELRRTAPHVDQGQLEQFLFYVLNAFDDIRCNSLWELLYAGSADRIWQRWNRISSGRGAEANSRNFIGFLFAVALGTPTTPDGPFEQMRPYIEWGMQNVRYKGYQRALLVARMALDRCIHILLAQMPPAQPQPQTGGEDGQEGQGAGNDAGGADAGTDSAASDQRAGAPGQDGQGGPDQDGGRVPAGAQSQSGASQSQDQGQGVLDPTQASNALSSLLRHSGPFDEGEEHHLPEKSDPSSLTDAARAKLAQVLQADLGDPELEIDLHTTTGFIDPGMQTAIDEFRDGVTQLSPDSQLMADAKAKILFLDVQPEGVDKNSRIILTSREVETVERMRGVFFRTLGRQKTQRSASGLSIDIDAAIQYDIDPSDPEIFEQDQNNQGFAYLTLCDMSGSMSGVPFRQVCHATEMLKQALHFPFVDGTLWGFRGGEGGKPGSGGEVWMYRYHKACTGYLGTARMANRPKIFPVECGGLTPMHSAVRVAVRHLLTRIQSGMAKRLFLLTDGSPCGTKTDGKGLPYWVLQQYVAKEIQWARQHGIQVYTLVIGGALEERESRLMFGSPRYWRNVDAGDNENSIDRVLQALVIQNFERYLKSRG